VTQRINLLRRSGDILDHDPDQQGLEVTASTPARLVRLAGAAALAVAMAVFVAPQAGPATAAAPVFKIVKAQYDSPGPDNRSNASINAEYVIVKNTTARTQTLTGWTVRDKQNHVFTFPKLTLGAGKQVVVRSGKGSASAANQYFNSGSYIWNNDGDAAILRTPAGATVQTCSWAAVGPGYKNC